MVSFGTRKELESCLNKLDHGLSRKRLNSATQQRTVVFKLELKNQLARTWEKLLLVYFEDEMRTPSSAPPLMTNPFVRIEGQLLFTCCLAGLALEDLISRVE